MITRALDHDNSVTFDFDDGGSNGPTLNPTPTGTSNGTANGGGGERDAYEFVAFLLWYLFLVLCCVLPTCCAYRRRRLMQARIQQQQANFEQIQQQNLLILNNLHIQQTDARADSEEVRAERTQFITDALMATSFTVQAKHIVDKDEVNENEHENGDNANVKSSGNGTAENDSKPVASQDVGGNDDVGGKTTDGSPSDRNNTTSLQDGDIETNQAASTSASASPEAAPTTSTTNNDGSNSNDDNNDDADEDGLADDFDDTILMLPKDMPNGNRKVAGGCAICLCPYEPGDVVAFAQKQQCKHAFHKDCIVPWLAKKNEPKCPCCRQDFCEIPPTSQTQMYHIHAPLRNRHTPTNFSTHFGILPMHSGLEHHGGTIFAVPRNGPPMPVMRGGRPTITLFRGNLPMANSAAPIMVAPSSIPQSNNSDSNSDNNNGNSNSNTHPDIESGIELNGTAAAPQSSDSNHQQQSTTEIGDGIPHGDDVSATESAPTSAAP